MAEICSNSDHLLEIYVSFFFGHGHLRVEFNVCYSDRCLAEGFQASPTPSMSTPHANGLAASNGSPKLAVIDSSFAREAKIASRTIKAQDKLISDLKAEVEKQKNNVQENVSQIQQQSLRMEHLEHEISNVKQLNRSLMEDNESYQMLLHEKTINGEIMLNSFMQVAIQII